MSLFHLLAGMTEGANTYVQQQRQLARAKEDKDLDARMAILRDYIQSPNFNSQQFSGLITGLLQNAPGAAGSKTKGGKEGFLGEHEGDSISQALAGFTHGDHTKPIQLAGQHPADVPLKGAGQQDPSHPVDFTGAITGVPTAPAAGPGGTAPSGGMAPPPAAAGDQGGAGAGATLAPPPGGAPAGGPSQVDAAVPSQADAAAGPAPAAAAGPAAMQPVPESSLPKPPGTSAMLNAGNQMAQEAQVPVPAAGTAGTPGTTFPKMQLPFSEQDIAAEDAKSRDRNILTDMGRTMREANSLTAKNWAGVSGKLGPIFQMIDQDPGMSPQQKAQAKRFNLLRESMGSSALEPVQVMVDPNDPSKGMKYVTRLEAITAPETNVRPTPGTGAIAAKLSQTAQGIIDAGEAVDMPQAMAMARARQNKMLQADLDSKLAGIRDKNLASRIKSMVIAGQPLPKDLVNAAATMGRASGQPFDVNWMQQAAEQFKGLYGALRQGAPGPGGKATPGSEEGTAPAGMSGGAPGAPGPAAAQTPMKFGKFNTEQQKVIDGIKQGAPMIDRVEQLLGSMEDDNSVSSKIHAMGQRGAYWAGFKPSDPVYQQLIPLVSFLKVFNTQPYLRGMRNMAYVKQIQEHMPSPTDTPALIHDKLVVIKQNLRDIMGELRTAGPAGGNLAAPPQ